MPEKQNQENFIHPKITELSLEDLKQQTPMDMREIWDECMDHVQEVRKNNVGPIKQIDDQLKEIKGKRKKEFVEQRKKLNRQREQLLSQESCLITEYENQFIGLQEKFLNDALQRALQNGLPDEDEIKEEFRTELSLEISDQRLFIEYNYKKTYEQIYQMVLDNLKMDLEAKKEAQEKNKIPTEKFVIYNIGDMFGVRENMDNPKGFGDPVFKTKIEAKKHVQEQQRIIQANQASHEKQKKIEEKQKKVEEAKEKKQSEIRAKSKVKIDPSLFDNLLPQVAGRVKKFLDKQIKFKDMGVVTWRDVIESGKYVRKEQVSVPAIKYNRKKYNRMGPTEQLAYEKRLKETKNEWRLYTKDDSFVTIPKSVFQVISVESQPEQEQSESQQKQLNSESLSKQPELKSQSEQQKIIWLDTQQNGFQLLISKDKQDRQVFHIQDEHISLETKEILQNNGFVQVEQNILQAKATLRSTFCLKNLLGVQKIETPVSEIQAQPKQGLQQQCDNQENNALQI